MFASTRRLWGWAFGLKVSSAQVFYFCNGKVKTWRIDNIWNFATFNLYTVQAEILYLQRDSTDCRNLSFSSKRLTVAIWVESFRCAGILLLQWQGENFAHRQPLKFCHFQPVHCASRNPISPKIFNRLSKSLPQLEDVDGGPFGWKVSGAQVFYFLQWQGETLRIDNIWNFATFNLYTVPAKILYLQRYSTDFWNLWLSSKMLRVGIWVVSFRGVGIFLLQWQGENLGHRQHFKFCHFQPVHGAGRNPISPKGFNRLSKSFLQLEEVDGGHLGGKFQVRRYLLLQWQGENFAHRQPLKFCHFQPVHCASRNPISPKIFNRLSKSLPQLEDVDGGHQPLGWKVSGAQVFYFCNGKVKLCASTTFEILPLSTCTLCQPKSYISKGIRPIFEIFDSARRCWGWAFGW